MQVLNVHEVELEAPLERVGALIDSLASSQDGLWPRQTWPAMRFDRPLDVGASGGHGPIRYVVEAYDPGRSVKFRFTAPAGFDGFHQYTAHPSGARGAVLRHTVNMTGRGAAILSWPLVFRPLHDALIEDSFAAAAASLGLVPRLEAWSLWVRLLRWLISGGRARRQVTPRGRLDPGTKPGPGR